jgi:AraC family ethanolamine operon transcriptional activator
MQKSKTTAPNSQILSGVIRREAVEDMSAAVSNFFDLDAVQLEPGPMQCQIDFVAAGDTFFYLEHYPLRTHLTGELLHNRFGFAVPLEGPSVTFAGEDMERSRLASAITGEEFDLHAAGGLKQCVVLLDHRRLLGLAEEFGLPAEIRRALQPGRPTAALTAKPAAVSEFGRRLCRMLPAASTGRLSLDAAQLQDWLYAETLGLLEVRGAPFGRPPSAVLVRRAVEIAEAYRGPLPIAQLCSLLRVSPGTLEHAFKSVAGITPHAFFLRRRLNKARSALLSHDADAVRVTDIATDFGFNELGRFAVRYREMFGESPSETLRRVHKARVSFSA